MRATRVPGRMNNVVCSLVIFLTLGIAPGCWWRARADFPRPPAVAATPPQEAIADAPPPEETSVVEAPVVETDPPPQPAEPELPPEKEPEPPPRAPPPEPPPEMPAEPPSIELAGAESTDPELRTKLGRASSLLSSLGTRELSDDQRQQYSSARAFVAQAERALDAGDERRALVLIDKGIILAEDVERTSRP